MTNSQDRHSNKLPFRQRDPTRFLMAIILTIGAVMALVMANHYL
jgi:hypothetical protein